MKLQRMSDMRPLLLGLLITQSTLVMAEPPPERVNDLAYGEVLYDFYQQDYMQALTTLAVAESRAGGIQGHGSHPEIVKGGMLLSYGMLESASRIFQQLISEKGSDKKESASDTNGTDASLYVTPKVRLQAWFYLAKVHYLRRDWPACRNALSQISAEQLEDLWPEVLEEFLYLKAQAELALEESEAVSSTLDMMDDLLDDPSVRAAYIRFNQAVDLLGRGDQEGGLAMLEVMDPKAEFEIDELEQDDPLRKEVLALQDRIILTQGSVHLAAEQPTIAMDTYRRIRLDSPWQEKALFGFALAAADAEQFGLALEALNRLEKTESNTPWSRESYYAIAYIYEQLNQPGRALQAYDDAVKAYTDQSRSMQGTMRALTLNTLVEGIAIPEQELPLESIADARLGADAYGRLQVKTNQQLLAPLFSSERFLNLLQRVRELTLLLEDLRQSEQNMATFEAMLETRELARERRIQETESSLQTDRIDSIRARRNALASKVQRGWEERDGDVFLSAEQLEFRDLIESVQQRLERLQNDPDIAEYREKFRRLQGYFRWQVSESVAEQGWQAVSGLKQLDEQLAELEQRLQRLRQLMADESELSALESRVKALKPRIASLIARTTTALEDVERETLAMARNLLEQEHSRTLSYLQASKLARARIADDLFRTRRADYSPDSRDPSDDTGTAENSEKGSSNSIDDNSVADGVGAEEVAP